jgi:hypothetical protein
MSKYQRLCRTNTAPAIEYAEHSSNDGTQDAWLGLLEYRRSHARPIPNAETEEELYERYLDDAGLLASLHAQASVDAARQRFGRGKIIRAFDSLEQGDASELVEMLEDLSAEIPFRMIESQGEFKALLDSVDKKKRQALLRFAAAWALKDAGVEIPSRVLKALARDRITTGLSLSLR